MGCIYVEYLPAYIDYFYFKMLTVDTGWLLLN